MEALWVGKLAHLRHLFQLHPDWTGQQVADAAGCSKSMVSKWRRRKASASSGDISVLFSRSRAPHHHPARDFRASQRAHPADPSGPDLWACSVRQARWPSPTTWPPDQALQATSKHLPRSTRTIWRLLDAAGLIWRDPLRKRSAHEPPASLEEVQMDCKDLSTVPMDRHDPDAKRAHVIETCNFVDAGTSILLHAQVHEDFHAETAFQAVVAFLRRYGCPTTLTFDRDPRWIGSATARDFPSALCQFLHCVGIQPHILPPRRPDLNCSVERYHRTRHQRNVCWCIVLPLWKRRAW
jgi:hypothetical protein